MKYLVTTKEEWSKGVICGAVFANKDVAVGWGKGSYGVDEDELLIIEVSNVLEVTNQYNFTPYKEMADE